MSDSFDRLLAQSQGRPGSSPRPCPEASVLAAYLDGTLARTERTALESHVADCGRCALQLATVVRLEDATGHPQQAPRARWWRRMAWVIPAATAVVAAVYLAVPSNVPGPRPALEVGPAEPAKTAQDSVAIAEPQAPALSRAPLTASAEVRPDVAAPARQRARPAPARQEPKGPPAAVGAAVPLTAAKAEGVTTDMETLERHAVAPPLPEADTRALSGAVAVEAPAMVRKAPASLRIAEPKGASPFTVQSPDGLVHWRIAAAGVERSSDGGRTWSPERAPAVSDVTMGAAPGGNVCWLATPAGRVLRRNEDGEWHDVSPVPPVTLAWLQAATPREAVLVAHDGSRIITADAGHSWTRQAPR